MTVAELVADLERRAAEGERIAATAPVATIYRALAAELGALDDAGEAVTPAQAARLTGYSAEHIARLARQGKIPNLGRKHAPRVRLADVPRKAGTLAGASAAPHLVGATRRELTRAVANE